MWFLGYCLLIYFSYLASKNIGIKNKNYSENKCTVGFQIVNIQTTITQTLEFQHVVNYIFLDCKNPESRNV